jgi:hypothetical protein
VHAFSDRSIFANARLVQIKFFHRPGIQSPFSSRWFEIVFGDVRIDLFHVGLAEGQAVVESLMVSGRADAQRIKVNLAEK